MNENVIKYLQHREQSQVKSQKKCLMYFKPIHYFLFGPEPKSWRRITGQVTATQSHRRVNHRQSKLTFCIERKGTY